MIEADLDTLAGEYVLGTLEGAEREEFTRRLAEDPKVQRMVDRWSARMNAMLAPPPVEPSETLWKRIDTAIEKRQAVNFGGVNVRAAEGEWTEIAAGAYRKPLHVDHAAGTWSFLLRLEPGAAVPSHAHRGMEECMVINGDMVIGQTVFFAGDYHMALPNSEHPQIASNAGATIFIRAPLDA